MQMFRHNQKKSFIWMRRYLPFMIICILVMGGCEACRVTVPKSDETPPNVFLLISGPDVSEMVSLDTGSKSVTLDKESEYILTAMAIDNDGGVRAVGIGGGLSVYCSSEKLGQVMHYDYYKQEPSNPSDLNPGDTGPTVRFAQMKLNEGRKGFSCQSGFRFEGASGFFVASAENYHHTTADCPALMIKFE
jgi:hypothetical protein